MTVIPGMGHDLATGLIPILVEAIATHCRAADEKSNPDNIMEKIN